MSKPVGVQNVFAPCLDEWRPNEATFYWQMESAAELAFTIHSIDERDDIDFVLYEINPHALDCSQWDPVRCSASGPSLPFESVANNCLGATGLTNSSGQTSSYRGCKGNNGNFLTSVQSKKDMIYALTVINFTSNNGFRLEFENKPQFNQDNMFPFSLLPLAESDFDIVNGVCVLKMDQIAKDEIPLTNASSIALVPNPAHSHVTIISHWILTAYRLYDSTGRMIDNRKFSLPDLYRISLQNLPSGIYTVELMDESGHSISQQISKI